LFARTLADEQKQALLAIWRRQLVAKAAIDSELELHIQAVDYSRYFFSHIDEQSAAELLRSIIVGRTKAGPIRPQLQRAVLAIKTARAGTTFEIGSGVKLLFNVRTFIVETP
jgi:hypothetical protein